MNQTLFATETEERLRTTKGDQNTSENVKVDFIADRIKKAIETDSGIKAIYKALEAYHQKKSGIAKMIEENSEKKILLTDEMEKLTKSFGDSPDDIKRMNDIRTELSSIDGFIAMLTTRLEHDGPLYREGKDLDRTFSQNICRVIDPIRNEYQNMVNQRFNDLVQILSDFAAAVDLSWPRKLADGTLVYSDYKDQARSKLTVTDVVDKLGGHTDEFFYLKRGAFSQGMSMAVQPDPVIPQQPPPLKVERPQVSTHQKPAPLIPRPNKSKVVNQQGSTKQPRSSYEIIQMQGGRLVPYDKSR